MAKKKISRTRQTLPQPPTRHKMLSLARWLDEKQARDIMLLDVAGLCSIAEGMVLASAHGARHAQALAGHLLDRAGEQGWECLGLEGQAQGNWILVDFNDVLVHVFQEETRSFYNLEGLWSEAERLDPGLSGAAPAGAEARPARPAIEEEA